MSATDPASPVPARYVSEPRGADFAHAVPGLAGTGGYAFVTATRWHRLLATSPAR